jgi:hypothetical protein
MDRRDYKMSKALIIKAVWNMNSPRAVRQGRYSGVFCASLGQMKNQKKLLVYVM